MPELPEVEVVRAGLARHVVGRTVTGVDVLDPRPLRRQDGGAHAFVDQLTGRILTAAVRRGKFLWLTLDDGRALSAHLGMSGQLLVRGTAASAGAEAAPGAVIAAPFLLDPDTQPNGRPVDLSATEQPRYVRDISTSPRHLRVRIHLSTDPSTEPSTDDGGDGAALDLVDQVKGCSVPTVIGARLRTRVGAEMDAHAQVTRRGRDVPYVAGLLGGAQVHRASVGLSIRVEQEGGGDHCSGGGLCSG